jgi:hypothetical protein
VAAVGADIANTTRKSTLAIKQEAERSDRIQEEEERVATYTCAKVNRSTRASSSKATNTQASKKKTVSIASELEESIRKRPPIRKASRAVNALLHQIALSHISEQTEDERDEDRKVEGGKDEEKKGEEEYDEDEDEDDLYEEVMVDNAESRASHLKSQINSCTPAAADFTVSNEIMLFTGTVGSQAFIRIMMRLRHLMSELEETIGSGQWMRSCVKWLWKRRHRLYPK